MANFGINSSDDKWYSKPIFRSFWNHYNHCNQWLEQNGHKVTKFSDDIDLNEDICHHLDTHSNTNVFRQRMDALEVIDENECNFYDKDSKPLTCDVNQEFDVSEEYLNFIIETKRHQKERKKLKEKRLRYNSRVEYIDISRLDSFSRRSVAPKGGHKSGKSHSNEGNGGSDMKSEQELRQQKMFELYGEDCHIIQGMEAALQLNFDRLCDRNQPKFWPIMPIRMSINANP